MTMTEKGPQYRTTTVSISDTALQDLEALVNILKMSGQANKLHIQALSKVLGGFRETRGVVRLEYGAVRGWLV